MTERTIETVVGWNLTRFEYDGAPVEAHRPRDGRSPRVDLENDRLHFTLTWDEPSDSGYGRATRGVSVPVVVIRRVLELDGAEPTRIANLRAALASIETRAAQYAEASKPPEQVGFANIRAAALGALEADDREAKRS